jgi:hypothetical protein
MRVCSICEAKKKLLQQSNGHDLEPIETVIIQSRFESFIEQVCNIGSGMILAYMVMQLILAPLLHIGITPMQNIWTTTSLTIVSVIRGYVWRRVFNKRMYKDWVIWARKKLERV